MQITKVGGRDSILPSLRDVIMHSAVSLFNALKLLLSIALKVLGTHCPSLATKVARGHSILFSPTPQTARNFGEVLHCEECGKPRVLYCDYKLSYVECEKIKAKITSILYSCGAMISELVHGDAVGDDCGDVPGMPSANTTGESAKASHNPVCHVYVRIFSAVTQLKYGPYYLSNIFEDCCVHCGSVESLQHNLCSVL